MDSSRRVPSLRTFSWLPAIALAVCLIVACSSDDGADAPTPVPAASATTAVEPSPSATQATETAAAPTPTVELPSVTPIAGATEPDGERILEAVKTFSDTVGPRVAGTEGERVAAGLIGDWLKQMGYEVELQEFGIGTQIGRSSGLTIDGPDMQTVPTLPFSNSGDGEATGRLVYADAGLPEQFPPDAQGAITLIRRDGEVFFQEKVANAVAAGASGVVIYNNEPGILLGNLQTAASVPVVGISMAEGEDLVEALEEGPLTATVHVGAVGTETSYNVIARPAGIENCETVTGGHYDSVAAGTGASDNASGTATVLEVAAVLAHNGGMGANCFVLFGAEELGLLGSTHFVSQLTEPERSSLKAMLNLDMVGVGDEAWWLIGDAALQERMAGLAPGLGIEDAMPSTLIRGLSSDHASFINGGIPALMFHRWEDPLLHTPQDVSDRIVPEYLEEAARMSIALLEALASDG